MYKSLKTEFENKHRCGGRTCALYVYICICVCTYMLYPRRLEEKSKPWTLVGPTVNNGLEVTRRSIRVWIAADNNFRSNWRALWSWSKRMREKSMCRALTRLHTQFFCYWCSSLYTQFSSPSSSSPFFFFLFLSLLVL